MISDTDTPAHIRPIVFFYKDSNVIAEFALATSEHDVDMLQNEFNSVNMSIVSGGTASSTSSARNTSANNASPPVRSNAINDTQPEPDTANVRRLNHGAMNLDYESDTPSPKRPSTNASYRESLKRLKQARRPHHTSTSNNDGSSSLEMHGPIFSPRSPNYNHNSFESMDNDLPFNSNPGNGEGSSSHKY
jgi:hypothetical protein